MREAMDLTRKLFNLVTSRTARQTYIHTFLCVTAGFILLQISFVAYILFYFSFIPRIEVTKVVHLQYGHGPHPYGIIQLGVELISRQAYDIFLTLDLPRSPPNLMRGNFMLNLALLPPTNKLALNSFQKYGISQQESLISSLRGEDILFAFRRTAIMTYTSLLVSLSSRLVTLPLYILGLRAEKESLTINIADGVVFSRGWKNIPDLALLEIQAGQGIQIYDALISFKARLSGLRWFMYNYRITSFLIFSALFWVSTIVFASLAMVTLSVYNSSELESFREKTRSNIGNAGIKREESVTDEEPDLSDTPRTFPTYGRQPPLRFTPKVKDELDDTGYMRDESIIKAEGGDEDEDEEGYISAKLGMKTDSGIGSSLSERGEKAFVRRRLSSRVSG